MLKIGPAIVPVIAISPKPFFVIAMSAFVSPRLLPHERIVRASKFFGSSDINPKRSNRSMMHFEVNDIQAMLIIKLKIWKTLRSSIGPFVFLVFILIQIDIKSPGINKSLHMFIYSKS
jgi:hypothetical protein